MARRSELTGVVVPDVEDSALDRNVKRPMERALDRAASGIEIAPKIAGRRIQRELEQAIPGGQLLGSAVDAMRGGRGSRSGSGGSATAAGGGRDKLVDLAKERNAILDRLAQTTEKAAVSGGGGGGGGGLLKTAGNISLGAQLSRGGGIGGLLTGGALATAGGAAAGIGAVGATALGAGELAKQILGVEVEGGKSPATRDTSTNVGRKLSDMELPESIQNFEWPEPPELPNLSATSWPAFPELPELSQEVSWPELPELPSLSEDLSWPELPELPSADDLPDLAGLEWPEPPSAPGWANRLMELLDGNDGSDGGGGGGDPLSGAVSQFEETLGIDIPGEGPIFSSDRQSTDRSQNGDGNRAEQGRWNGDVTIERIDLGGIEVQDIQRELEQAIDRMNIVDEVQQAIMDEIDFTGF